MRRRESFRAGHRLESPFGPPERSRSAGVYFSPLKRSGLARLVVAIGTLAVLVEMLAERPEPEPEAQVWVARVADCGTVDTVIFSRDGKSLASLDSNGRALLWDVATGRQSEEQPEGFDGLRALAFSPDGTNLAGGKLDSTVVFWDLKSLKVQAELHVHPSPVNGLAYSPDGRMLASVSGDGTLVLWQTPGYSLIHQLRSPTRTGGIALAPDGGSLAISHCDGEVRIRQVGAPRYSALVGRFSCPARGLAFSPDGGTLAASAISSPQILLWDLSARRLRTTLIGPASGVTALAFSPDGRLLVAAGSGGDLQLNDLIAGREYTIAHGHRDGIWSVAFSPDGQSLATGGNDHCVRFWDVAKLMLARNDQAVPQLRLERGQRSLN
jgi:WD40 repeat protein